MTDLGSRIWWTVRSYARDDDHADDLAQDCWAAILERLHRYGGRGSFANWAIAVSKNVCLMHLRKAKRTDGGDCALDDAEAVLDDAPDPAQELILKQQREVLNRALGELPDRERDAIVLRVLEQRTPAETARALGMNVDGSRLLFLRAISRLRGMEQIQKLATDQLV